jgi:hypothetical protein
VFRSVQKVVHILRMKADLASQAILKNEPLNIEPTFAAATCRCPYDDPAGNKAFLSSILFFYLCFSVDYTDQYTIIDYSVVLNTMSPPDTGMYARVGFSFDTDKLF